MMTSLEKKTEKNVVTYNCEHCDYLTSNKTDYSRHLLTAKHIKNKNVDNMLSNIDTKNLKNVKKFNSGENPVYNRCIVWHNNHCQRIYNR